MLNSIRLLLVSCCFVQAAFAADDVIPDISGEWVVNSSVGGETPITVHCTLEQNEFDLTGTCTPEMENAETSALTGSVTSTSASWGYDVVFNSEPGRVDFLATSLMANRLSGTLSLSGTEAPFTAERR